MSQAPHTPVLIVGAGPVGLTLALCLARRGVPCMLVEVADDISREGSKAICIQEASLEILERAATGCGQAIAERGVTWTIGRTSYRSTALFSTHFEPTGGVFPPFVNLAQADTTALLLTAAQGAYRDLIELRFGHRVVALEDAGDAVTLTVEGPRGRDALRAGVVVGCDGAHSTVRRLIGVGFPGHSHPDWFLIADIRAKLPFPNERRFFFNPPFNPGHQVLVMPQPDNIWRIDWGMRGNAHPDEERTSGRLDRRIRAIAGDADYEIVWVSAYRFHQRLATSLRVGRVFLAGDAAHLMSPFGARGMNSGIADAENLAWKLWLVMSGRAPAALLATYDAERRAAAIDNLAITDATMRFMVPPTHRARLARNAILRGSTRSAALRRRVDSGRLFQPFAYADSPIVVCDPTATPDDPLRPGAVAPDAPCHLPDGTPSRLRALIGDKVIGLYVSSDASDAARFATRALATLSSSPSQRYLVGPLQPSALAVPDTVGILDDHHGRIADTYKAGTGTLYLLRPDGHIAARTSGPDAEPFPRLVDLATGWHLPPVTDQLGTLQPSWA